jgi:tetratricopeptide (TPR) repeat protein
MNLFRRKKPTEIVDNRVDVDPDELQAGTADEYLRRGLIYKAHGEQAKAEADLKKVLSLDPESVDAQYNLGLIFRETGRTAEAREAFRTALANNKLIEERDPARALMITRLTTWQLKHLEAAV